MKVAVIHHSYALKGGLERYLLDLVRGLVEAGDEVGVWAREIDEGAPTFAQLQLHRVYPWPVPRPWRSQAFASALAKLKLRETHDLTLSLDRTTSQDIYVCGGTHPGFMQATGRGMSLHARKEIAGERAACDSSRHIVAHSKKVAQELRQNYPSASAKTTVLYPPLDTTRFHPPKDDERRQARAALGLTDERLVLLFPATGHAPSKGLPLLLQALARLPEKTAPLLLVAGRAPESSSASVRALGFVQDMRSIYVAADYTVLPSRYEAFGLVVAESLQCGTPAITSRETGVAELLDASDGVVLAELSTDCLEQALLAAAAKYHRPQPDFAARKGLLIGRHVQSLHLLAST